MKREKFIADGKFFYNLEAVEAYAKEKGLRIANTETIGSVSV